MFPLDPNAPKPRKRAPQSVLDAGAVVFRCNDGVEFRPGDNVREWTDAQRAAIRGGIAAAERHANRRRS